MELFNLTDEEVWLKYMLVLAGNPENKSSVESDTYDADEFLRFFKYRFRDGE